VPAAKAARILLETGHRSVCAGQIFGNAIIIRADTLHRIKAPSVALQPVIAPFYYQNLLGAMAPQKQADGALGWALPLNPERRVIHMGDITELGRIVVGAFERPELAGHGEHLPLVGDFLSFNEIAATLNRQGHKFSFKQVPREVFAGWFPDAADIAAMLAYFEAHTYLGSDSREPIALANKVAGFQPTKLAAWSQANLKVSAAA
jgi:hypothetical protein